MQDGKTECRRKDPDPTLEKDPKEGFLSQTRKQTNGHPEMISAWKFSR